MRCSQGFLESSDILLRIQKGIYLLLGRKVMMNLGSMLKSRDVTLPTKVKSYGFSSSHVRVGPQKSLSTKELVLSNCSAEKTLFFFFFLQFCYIYYSTHLTSGLILENIKILALRKKTKPSKILILRYNYYEYFWFIFLILKNI